MAPSQEYLDLLDSLRLNAETAETAEWNLLSDWSNVCDSWQTSVHSMMYLALLADSAFSYVVTSRNSSRYLIGDELRKLHIAKNAGYTGDNPDPWWNFRQCEVFGITAVQGVLTRLADKISRLQMLRANIVNEQVGENILDTVMDICSYALIAVCLLREK